MRAISVNAMRKLEAEAIASGISGYTLMENAGIAAAKIIAKEAIRRECEHIAIFCGAGNNGGDGFVIANHLKGFNVEIFLTKPISQLKGDAYKHAQLLDNNIVINSLDNIPQFTSSFIVVDALLGTGFKGDLRPAMASVIEAINSSNATVIAIDLPSGLDGDSGDAKVAIRADKTITFGLPKIGLFKARGAEFSGIIYVGSINIPDAMLNSVKGEFEVITSRDIAQQLKKLKFNDYKNSRGRVLIAGGSKKYTGAPILSAYGAMRSGAGFVRLITTAKIENRVPAALVMHSVKDWNVAIGAVDAVVAGMGWGKNKKALKLLKKLLKQNIPTLLDADALNLLSIIPELKITNPNTIITPHIGEAQRLFSAYNETMPPDRVDAALKLAQITNSTVVWKGPQSIIATAKEEFAINSNGSAALGVCGSGDVLSGVIGAFLAMGYSPFEAAKIGVFLHGQTGDRINLRGLIADDIPMLIAQNLSCF